MIFLVQNCTNFGIPASTVNVFFDIKGARIRCLLLLDLFKVYLVLRNSTEFAISLKKNWWMNTHSYPNFLSYRGLKAHASSPFLIFRISSFTGRFKIHGLVQNWSEFIPLISLIIFFNWNMARLESQSPKCSFSLFINLLAHHLWDISDSSCTKFTEQTSIVIVCLAKSGR